MWNLWWIDIILGVLCVVAILLGIKYNSETWGYVCGTLFLAVLICTTICIDKTVSVKQEYAKYQEVQTMVQEIYDSGKDYDNIGVSSKIIEVNEWLANAKASKKQWGNWSKYCTVDIDGLEYITLGGQDN